MCDCLVKQKQLRRPGWAWMSWCPCRGRSGGGRETPCAWALAPFCGVLWVNRRFDYDLLMGGRVYSIKVCIVVSLLRSAPPLMTTMLTVT